MNRLVIVGNGFDIAMGCPTRVEDFILQLLILDIEKMYFGRSEEVKYLNPTRFQYYFSNHELMESIKKDYSLEQLLNHLKLKNIGIKDLLLEQVIKNRRYTGWYDIECTYRDVLFKSYKSNNRPWSIERMTLLNDSMAKICIDLEEYLKAAQLKFDSRVNSEFREFFYKFFQLSYCFDERLFIEGQVAFVNFNYTNILSKCISGFMDIKSFEIYHIHGSLENTNGNSPILVGYGDDISKSFEDILSFQDYELSMQFIKPMHYGRNDTFSQILNFVNSGDFELYIVGHSCSRSDHTILSSLVNNLHCKGIRIFHRGHYEDYFKRSASLTIHFESRQRAKEIIFHHDLASIIPSKEIKKS
jgi:hypothetical protein